MKKISPLFIALTLAQSVAADEYNDDFIDRPATNFEMSLCDHSRDLGGQIYNLGNSGIDERPVEILLCSSNEVWQMSCDFAKAMAVITGSAVQRSKEDTIEIDRHINNETQGAANTCNGLFLS